MAAAAKTMILLILAFTAMLGSASAALRHVGILHHHHHRHQVGGAVPWSPSANPQEWASKHTFHVGDTIGFKYIKGKDSVVLVDRLAYHACDPSSPLAYYNTGNDAITFKRKGHYFFIYGIKHNCKFHNQKFNVRIPRGTHTAASQPSWLSPLFVVAISLAAIGAILLIIVLIFWFRSRKHARMQPSSDASDHV